MMLNYLAYFLSYMFFRRIIISGTPYTGKSALWAVNHSNGIVDPTVLLALAPVLLRPLAKATLWKNFVMEFFLNLTRAIPVARWADVSEMFRNSAVDPTWVKSVNTAAFQNVNNALLNGENVLIFPEGLSHDDPFLHPLKTGVARMALQALNSKSEENFQVTIQPVVLDYSEKNEFRSELYIEYCEPIVVTKNDTSADAIMERLFKSFKEHFVKFESWDEKRNWQYLFRIYYGRSPASLQEFHDFVKKSIKSVEDDAVLFGKIQTMRCMLQGLEIFPENQCWRLAAYGKEDNYWFFKMILRFLTVVFIRVPFLILEVIVWGIPLWIASFLGGHGKHARDVYATMKIAHAMWVLPSWVIFVLGPLTFLIKDYFPAIHPILIWFIMFFSTPVLLSLGLFVAEHLDFCVGYVRFGVLQITFPRGLEEMKQEWRQILGAVIKKVNQ